MVQEAETHARSYDLGVQDKGVLLLEGDQVGLQCPVGQREVRLPEDHPSKLFQAVTHVAGEVVPLHPTTVSPAAALEDKSQAPWSSAAGLTGNVHTTASTGPFKGWHGVYSELDQVHKLSFTQETGPLRHPAVCSRDFAGVAQGGPVVTSVQEIGPHLLDQLLVEELLSLVAAGRQRSPAEASQEGQLQGRSTPWMVGEPQPVQSQQAH